MPRPVVHRAAAVTTSALLLPALLASPASAELVSGQQDIREQACAPLPTILDRQFTDLGGTRGEFALAAECLADFGITNGVTNSRYVPNATLRRDQMAQFLVRQAEAVGVEFDDEDAADAGFTDVAGAGLTPEAVRSINIVANLGVSIGTGDGSTFSPRAAVRRDQMAAFITRLQDVLADVSDDDDDDDTNVEAFDRDADEPFTDTDSPEVAAVFDAGIALGTSATTFDPAAPVTRAQMAGFLSRHVNVVLRQLGGVSFEERDNRFSSNVDAGVERTTDTTANVATFTAEGLLPSTAYRITLVNTDAFTSVSEDPADADSDALVDFGAFVTADRAAGTAVPGEAAGVVVGAVNGTPTTGDDRARTLIASTDDDGQMVILVDGTAASAEVELTPFVYLVPESSVGFPNYETLLEVDTVDDVASPLEPFDYATDAATFTPSVT